MSTVTQHDRYPSRGSSQPGLVDRKDPVVAETARDVSAGPLTAEQVEFFDENGYVFLEGIFSAEEVAQYVAELQRLSQADDVISRPETITEKGSDEVRSIFAIHKSSQLLGEMSADARLAGATSQLLGSDVYMHQSRINFKPGFGGDGFYWHSDFETWHTEDGMPGMRAISASIALTDNTEHNGPLMVMPGSHRTYVVCAGETPPDNYKSSLKDQEIGTPDPDSLSVLADRHGIVAPKGRAGSVVFFDCNMMHGSNSNITPYPRSNVFFVYNSVENTLEDPFAAPNPRPEFIAHRDFTPIRRA